MVDRRTGWSGVQFYVSVLALSSRFDGRQERAPMVLPTCGFSTRSVESF